MDLKPLITLLAIVNPLAIVPFFIHYTQGFSQEQRLRTIRTASTLPSHASMLSGVDVNLHGLTWNNWRPQKGYIQVPTIFKAAEDNGLKTAAFVGKFKLRHILPAGTIDTFERPGYTRAWPLDGPSPVQTTVPARAQGPMPATQESPRPLPVVGPETVKAAVQ